MASSSSSSSNDGYEPIKKAVTQMNTVFNPEAIHACLDVIFDEEENEQEEASSSRVITRDHFGAAKLLYHHYFAPEPIYPPDMFRRRSRMRKEMFINDVGRVGFNIFQKCTAAIRQLAYSAKADALDEYLQMAQQTAYDCLDNFCKCVIHLYRDEYLRKPIEEDIQRLIAKHNEVHGFLGMLGSIDCMHWGWRTVRWRGKGSTLKATRDTQRSCLKRLLRMICRFGTPTLALQFRKGYYLADGIYPEWATLVKSFKYLMEPKTTKLKRYQEAARKDVERAFGVLQGRWEIIERHARPLTLNKIKRIMYTCVVLHNMIVEDNSRAVSPFQEELIEATAYYAPNPFVG